MHMNYIVTFFTNFRDYNLELLAVRGQVFAGSAYICLLMLTLKTKITLLMVYQYTVHLFSTAFKKLCS